MLLNFVYLLNLIFSILESEIDLLVQGVLIREKDEDLLVVITMKVYKLT